MRLELARRLSAASQRSDSSCSMSLKAPLFMPCQESLDHDTSTSVGEQGGVGGEVGGGEADKDDLLHHWFSRNKIANRVHGDLRSQFPGVSVGAGTDTRKGHTDQPGIGGQPERGSIARGKGLFLTTGAPSPDRTNGMDNILRRQPIALRQLGIAGTTAAQRTTLV